MKKTELQKLKNKNQAELTKDLVELKDKLWQLKVDAKSGKVKNVSEIRAIKKNIARIKTLLNRQVQ